MDQSDDEEEVPMQEEQYKLQKQLDSPIVFAVSTDPDAMYLHKAMTRINS